MTAAYRELVDLILMDKRVSTDDVQVETPLPSEFVAASFKAEETARHRLRSEEEPLHPSSDVIPPLVRAPSDDE